MLRVCTDLGRGKIYEGYIESVRHTIDGWTDFTDQSITINPIHSIVDTIIHEILHRLHPKWSENYVRRTTSFLKNRMTDAEIQAFYDEYRRHVKPLRTPRKAP